MPCEILRFFECGHLPPRLSAVAMDFQLLAGKLDDALPSSAEKSAGLRKLLEAKDCFVRAALPVPATDTERQARRPDHG